MQEFPDRDKTHAPHVFHNRRPMPHAVYSFENDDESGQRFSQECEILPTEATVEEPPGGSKSAKWEWSCASCLREESVKIWNYERELARQSGLPRIFKTLNKAQLADKVANRYRPSVPNAIWSLQNWCDMYDLRWPHRHLFDCDSITSSAEPVKGVFLVICNLPYLACLHARQGFSRPLAILIRWLFSRAFDNTLQILEKYRCFRNLTYIDWFYPKHLDTALVFDFRTLIAWFWAWWGQGQKMFAAHQTTRENTPQNPAKICKKPQILKSRCFR